eukprot:GHVS01015941.1.p1 GENE.GHVS01015941.1~~GHVS01015941.1.p1  ORF type:complete len:356 (+),score=136.32 GHVS01015941.1:359-1426(+)
MTMLSVLFLLSLHFLFVFAKSPTFRLKQTIPSFISTYTIFNGPPPPPMTSSSSSSSMFRHLSSSRRPPSLSPSPSSLSPSPSPSPSPSLSPSPSPSLSPSPSPSPSRSSSRLYFSMSAPPLRMDESPPHTPGRPTSPPLPVLLPVVDDGKLDVISKLLKDRILLLGNQVNDEVANALVAQFLYLANTDSCADIKLYINSPGGSVTAGLAIFDAMQFVPCDVHTVCFGLAASMGAFLLSAGTKGKRRALPNARIMIHQPLGGAQGQASDIEIQAKEILFTRRLLNTYMSHFTGQQLAKIEQDSDRDFFMTPQEALDYGLIDEVVKTKSSHISIPSMGPQTLVDDGWGKTGGGGRGG